MKTSLFLTSLLLGSVVYAIDIDKAVEVSLINNNDVKKQTYIWEESKENVNISSGGFKPKLDLSYSYSTNDENIGYGTDYSNGSATLSYNLFNGFKDMYNVRSSKDNAKSKEYILKALKQDVVFNTKVTYISYLRSLKNIETMQNAYELLEQQYKNSKSRFNQGILAKNELLQVNAQMLQAKQNLAKAKADERISWYELKNILGGKLDKHENIEDISKQKLVLEKYDVKELQNRSEIQALKIFIKSLQNKKNANNSSYSPSVDASLVYSKFGEDAFLEVEEGSVKKQKSANISVKWNLYNGGVNEATSVVYKKQILQLKEDLKKLELNINLQYEKALEEFKVAELNIDTAKISLEQSHENYKIVNNRFKEGLSNATDLINANYLLTAAKQSLDNAYYDKVLASASLSRIFEK